MIATISGEKTQEYNGFNNVINEGRPIQGEDYVVELIEKYHLDCYEKVNPQLVFYYSSRKNNDVVIKLEFESHYERMAFEKLV